MDVLIIGGTRFVGYQLAWRLIAGGHRVTLLNRGTRPDPFGRRIERLIADRSTSEFAAVLAGRRFDAVIDFAVDNGSDARAAVEVLGQERVGHYLLVSTGQVYLVRQNCPVPASEVDYDGPLLPRPFHLADLDQWNYGIRKRAAEDVLVEAWSSVGFPSTRLRIPMVNGERDHYRRVESYLWRILDGGPVILPDGGMHPMRHVYSGSVVQAICEILGDSASFGQVYNLAQEETPMLAEFVSLLAELVHAPPRLAPIPALAINLVGLDHEVISPFSSRWMSMIGPSKAKEDLGFRHEPLPRYLEKIVNIFLNAPPERPPANYANRAAEIALADEA